MQQFGSLGVPQTPKSRNDRCIQIHKKKKDAFFTYLESETLKIYFEVCDPFCQS